MTHHESAIDELAGRLQGTDATLTTSISDVLAAALQELIEAELVARIGAEPGERTPARPGRTAPSKASTAYLPSPMSPVRAGLRSSLM